MPNNRPFPARDNGFPQMQYLKADLSWNTPGLLGGAIKIGRLPAGAQLFPAKWQVLTIFDGTTPALTLGTTQGGANEILASGDIAETALGSGVANTPLALAITTDTDVWAKLTAVGATAGRAVVILPYAGAAG